MATGPFAVGSFAGGRMACHMLFMALPRGARESGHMSEPSPRNHAFEMGWQLLPLSRQYRR